jgi:hypothetical protein
MLFKIFVLFTFTNKKVKGVLEEISQSIDYYSGK